MSDGKKIDAFTGQLIFKGRTAKYFVEHGDRVLYPRKKVGDHYERISWEQAYREIAEKAKEKGLLLSPVPADNRESKCTIMMNCAGVPVDKYHAAMKLLEECVG